MKVTVEELQRNLAMFSGTEEYHHWSILFKQHVLTDGAQHLAETAGAYWLMDAIASHIRKVRNEPFQVWKLNVKDSKARLTCDDGNGNILVRQNIPYADFPMSEIKLYCEWGDPYWVIMLPGEY